MKLLITGLLAFTFLTPSYAQFGFIKNVVKKGGDIVKDGARGVGNVYQTATAPVRNVATNVYNNTLRQPVNEIRNGINSVLPDDVRNFYRYEIQNRIQPFVANSTGMMTGEVNIVDGTQQIVNHSINLVKELAVTPEIAALYYAARASSSPIPQEFFSVIAPHWPAVTNRPLHQSVAKYIVSQSLVNTLTAMGNSSMAAITLYDVIIFREPLSMNPNSLALLSHEMVHVAQYRELGFAAFLSTYIAENLANGYANSPKEREGYRVQTNIEPRLAGDAQSVNPQIRLSNVSAINYSSPTAATLAFFSAATNDPNEYANYMLTKIQTTNSVNDAKALIGYVLSNNAVSSTNKAFCCRLMSSGPLLNYVTPQERLAWAKSAASFSPSESVNWYVLAATAFQLQDASTEYDALINLAGIMISEELGKANPDYPRLYGASGHLGRAIQLSNFISFQQGRPYDNRMPFLMLIELGVFLPLDYSKDMQLNMFAQTLANIDAAMNIKDEMHLRVIGALTGTHLYFAIQNHRFYLNTGGPAYLMEKRNRAVASMNHAQWGLNELNMYLNNSPNASIYQTMFTNYFQTAGSYNN